LAYVCTDRGIPVPSHGSAAIHIASLLRAFAAAGHDVVAFLAAGEGEVEGASGVVRLRTGQAAQDLRSFHADEGHAVAAREIGSLISAARTAEALRAEHARRPFDAVIERLSLWTFGAASEARRLGIPHVLEVNSPVIWEQLTHRRLELVPAAEAAHAFVMAHTDRVFAVSEALALEYSQLTAAPVTSLPNGVDIERFQPGLQVAPRPAWAEGFVVGFVGTMKAFHDLDTVAEAAGLLPAGVRIVMIGDGPGSAALRDRCAALPGRLHLPGPVEHGQVPGLLGWFDVGLVPATAGHAYLSPLKLPEYLASGLPVIVAAGSQGADLLPESVREEYVSGSPTSLAAAIVRLQERARSTEVRAQARRVAEGRTWAAVAATMAAAAAELVRPSGP